MPGGADLGDVDPRRRRAWACLLQGAFLAVALAWFQLERVILAEFWTRANITLYDFLREAVPEVCVALVFDGAWLLLAWSRSRLGVAFFRAAFVASHAAIYAVIILDHHLFVHTGTRSSPDLARYAIANAMMLRGIAQETVEPDLVFRLIFTPVWLLLVIVLSLRRPLVAPSRRSGAIALAVGLVGALSVRGSSRIGASMFVELLQGSPWESYTEDRRRPELVGPIYEPPRVARLARRPSFLVVMLESMGAQVVPPTAPPELARYCPNLACLATRSLVFDAAYSVVPHTSKAHVVMMSGMFPRLEMPVVEASKGNFPLLGIPGFLGAQGYRTFYMHSASGKFEGWMGFIENLGFQERHAMEDFGDRFAHTGYFGMDEMAMLEPALEFMGRDPEQPFFAMLTTASAHHPYDFPGMTEEDRTVPTRERYLRAVRYTDHFVGTLLARVAELPLPEPPVVIVLGDHGEAMGQHGRFGHDAAPYEEGLHIPLMISGGALVGPPRRDGALRSQLDLAPTVLDLAGAEWEGLLPGISLLDPRGHERVVSSCYYTKTCVAMREGDRSYVFHYGRFPAQLFDLATDPLQQRDLAPGTPEGEMRDAEDRLLRTIFSVDAFYDAHPVRANR